MNRKFRYLLAGLFALGLCAAFVFFGLAPGFVDRQQNKIVPLPDEITKERDDRHSALYVADLHNDALLWNRDLEKLTNRGHSDIPRLQTGNTALQVFSAVTRSPPGLNNVRNEATKGDDITPLAIAQRWPIASWSSLFSRAQYQLVKLRALAGEYPDDITLVLHKEHLIAHRQRFEAGSDQIAALFLIEGAHPLEGKIENLDRLFAHGMRIIGLTHFFDNEVAGSLHGVTQGGLTPFGKLVVRRANELGLIIDIAHASPAAVRETLALTTQPMILSHGGMSGQCATPRNLSDELMQEFARAGGLLGIGFWASAVCDSTPKGIAQAIDFAVTTLGIEHVALGSDFDGAVTTRFDASRLDLVTNALFRLGYSEQDVSMIMGENAYNFFLRNLPSKKSLTDL